MTTSQFDPLPHHRIHVSTTDTGYAESCATCGWTTCWPSREQRQVDIDAHLTVPRTRGTHGVVAEGD